MLENPKEYKECWLRTAPISVRSTVPPTNTQQSAINMAAQTEFILTSPLQDKSIKPDIVEKNICGIRITAKVRKHS